jgi:hypothetical protein
MNAMKDSLCEAFDISPPIQPASELGSTLACRIYARGLFACKMLSPVSGVILVSLVSDALEGADRVDAGVAIVARVLINQALVDVCKGEKEGNLIVIGACELSRKNQLRSGKSSGQTFA